MVSDSVEIVPGCAAALNPRQNAYFDGSPLGLIPAALTPIMLPRAFTKPHSR